MQKGSHTVDLARLGLHDEDMTKQALHLVDGCTQFRHVVRTSSATKAVMDSLEHSSAAHQIVGDQHGLISEMEKARALERSLTATGFWNSEAYDRAINEALPIHLQIDNEREAIKRVSQEINAVLPSSAFKNIAALAKSASKAFADKFTFDDILGLHDKKLMSAVDAAFQASKEIDLGGQTISQFVAEVPDFAQITSAVSAADLTSSVGLPKSFYDELQIASEALSSLTLGLSGVGRIKTDFFQDLDLFERFNHLREQTVTADQAILEELQAIRGDLAKKEEADQKRAVLEDQRAKIQAWRFYLSIMVSVALALLSLAVQIYLATESNNHSKANTEAIETLNQSLGNLTVLFEEMLEVEKEQIEVHREARSNLQTRQDDLSEAINEKQLIGKDTHLSMCPIPSSEGDSWTRLAQ